MKLLSFASIGAALILNPFASLAQCGEIINLISTGMPDRGSTVTGFVYEEGGGLVYLWEDNIGSNPWNHDAKIYLSKTDENGNQMWQQEYGGDGYDRPGNLIKSAAGGFIIGAYGNSLGSNFSDSYVFKTDLNGEIEWSAILGGGSFGQNQAAHVLENPDGNVLLWGLVQAHPGCSGYAFRVTQLTPQGTVDWSFCHNESQWRGALPILLDGTAEYLYGETINEGMRFFKRSSDGAVTMSTEFFPAELSGTGVDLRGEIIKGLNGDYLLISGNPSDCFSSAIVKFNSNDEVEWSSFNPCGGAFPRNAVVLADGSWIIQFLEDNSSYFARYSSVGELLYSTEPIENLFITQLHVTSENELLYSGRYGSADNGVAVVEKYICEELLPTVPEVPECDPCLVNYMHGDFDCDGIVGSSDLLVFLVNFGVQLGN